MKSVQAFVTCLILVAVACDARAQSLQERIATVREQRNQAAQQQEPPQEPPSLQIPAKMSRVIDEVFFDETPAREVFDWWSKQTEVPMVIDWNAMELDGIIADQGITLNLRTVPARVLLDVIMRQASPDVELIYEVTPWYVEVLTKRQANRHPVLKVYDVSDMVMRIPNFTNAPRMDLNEALSNTNSGGSGGSGRGGGGGGGSGIFGNDDREDEDDVPTKNESGQSIAEMIRNTIEPDIWQENGGLYASARYYDGRLIVNAPMYVHRQIGIPTVEAYRPVSVNGYRSTTGGTAAPAVSRPFGTRER